MSAVNRRKFLARSLQTSAATAAWGLPSLLRAGSPSQRVVIALIGAGGRGRDVARKLAALQTDVRFKYVCDVEESRAKTAAAELAKIGGDVPQTTGDLRRVLDDRDVQGVIIATPEQWHALGTVWACQAGKDVYVEKNITLALSEGPQMIAAAARHKRVVQAGTQGRSWPGAMSARQYIAEGGLGQVLYVQVFGMLPGLVGSYPRPKTLDTSMPPGLDWDRWLGPARLRPYNTDLHRRWYGYWDFSGGNTSDALHTLDLARMVLGDPPHPSMVQCAGGRFQYADGGDLPDVQIVTFQYDKLVMSFFNTGFTPYLSKAPEEIRNGDKYPYWPQNADRIELHGTKRLMYLGRHGAGWQVFEKDGRLVAQGKAPHPDHWHLPNWIDCIRTRKEPNGNLHQGHASACLEHMANIAYRTGNQRLTFDARAERFVDNDAANRLLTSYYRKGYELNV